MRPVRQASKKDVARATPIPMAFSGLDRIEIALTDLVNGRRSRPGAIRPLLNLVRTLLNLVRDEHPFPACDSRTCRQPAKCASMAF